jgi:hypothetical protein
MVEGEVPIPKMMVEVAAEAALACQLYESYHRWMLMHGEQSNMEVAASAVGVVPFCDLDAETVQFWVAKARSVIDMVEKM